MGKNVRFDVILFCFPVPNLLMIGSMAKIKFLFCSLVYKFS